MKYTDQQLKEMNRKRLDLISQRVNDPKVVKSYVEAVSGKPKIDTGSVEGVINLIQRTQGIQ